jgi:hypothetical protein
MDMNLKFAVTAFSEITGRRFVVSRHQTRQAAERAARKYGLPEVRIEEIV